MSKLVWDPNLAPPIKRGVDRGVLYFRSYGPKVWNGLENVIEKADDTEQVVRYFDGQKFVQTRTPESFSATVEAYTFPDELASWDIFDFAYRVSMETGYELHIVYNAEAYVNEVVSSSLGGDVSTESFSWEISTVPQAFDGYRSTAHIYMNSNDIEPAALQQIEDHLYGTDTVAPAIMPIEDILTILDSYAVFIVTDNGDGTWTATGPDSWFQTIDATTVIITTPSIDIIDSESYLIRSW